jgi:hypothetical protein
MLGREPARPGRCTGDMRTPPVLLAIAAVALGPAAAASAKEIDKVKVCGADGCHDVTDRTTMAITDGGPPTGRPDEATPFYRVKISMKEPGGESIPGWSFIWVPAAELVGQEDGTWTRPPSTTVDELKLATRGIEPLPASKLALPEPTPDETPAGASAPATPPDDGGGPPTAVWVLLAAGALGLIAALARATMSALGRRGGSAPAG